MSSLPGTCAVWTQVRLFWVLRAGNLRGLDFDLPGNFVLAVSFARVACFFAGKANFNAES